MQRMPTQKFAHKSTIAAAAMEVETAAGEAACSRALARKISSEIRGAIDPLSHTRKLRTDVRPSHVVRILLFCVEPAQTNSSEQHSGAPIKPTCVGAGSLSELGRNFPPNTISVAWCRTSNELLAFMPLQPEGLPTF